MIRKKELENSSSHMQSQKSNKSQFRDLNDIYDVIGREISKEKANEIVNSLKICDPAVGSGHFLVSALNEIIAIKSELRILVDRQGRSLHHYNIEVANDELVITDEDGTDFRV